MALDYIERYPGQVVDDDPDYPFGKARNVLVEDDGTGTPLEKDLVNDIWGLLQALLTEADLTPSGVPDTAVASQYLTALRIIGGERLLEHRAMREWENVNLPFRTTANDRRYRFIAAPKLPDVDQHAVVALGWNTSNSDRFSYVRSFDGGRFDAEQLDASTTAGIRCAATGAEGEFLAGVVGSGVIVSHTQLGRVKVTTDALPTDAPSALHYAAYCTRYLAAGQTGGIYVGATLAACVAATPFLISGSEGFAIATLGVAGGEFIDDAAANIVYAGSGTISSVERFRILHSADDGDTWTVALTCGSGITALNVSWHAAEELFVALDSDGQLYTSPTGASWTLAQSTPITVAAGASDRHQTMAVAGNCIAKVYNPTMYTDYQGVGVAYSFDLGATWRTQYLGYGLDFTGDYDVSEDPLPLLSLVAANDRFFATDDRRVYRSGVLAFEALAP